MTEAAALYQKAARGQFKAVEAWKKILELDETDGKALSSLAELYHRSRRFEELVSVPDDAGAAAKRQRQSQHLGADRRPAFRGTGPVGAGNRSLPGTAADPAGLAQGTVGAKRWQPSRRLGAGAGSARSSSACRRGHEDKIAVLRKLAQLSLEKLHSVDDAVSHLQQVLELQPGDPDAQADLERLLEAGEKWYELVDVLVRHADASHKANKLDEEIGLLLRAAEIWKAKSRLPSRPKKLLERVLKSIEPRPGPDVAGADLRIAARLGALQATLEKAVRLAKTNAEMAELYYRLGRMESRASRRRRCSSRTTSGRSKPINQRRGGRGSGETSAVPWRFPSRRSTARNSRRTDAVSRRCEAKELLIELGRLYVNELKSPKVRCRFCSVRTNWLPTTFRWSAARRDLLQRWSHP